MINLLKLWMKGVKFIPYIIPLTSQSITKGTFNNCIFS